MKMTGQIQAKIFLGYERGCDETSTMRTLNTFNWGSRYSEHKQPFGNLYVLNEDTLAPECIMEQVVDRKSYLLLLPLVGLVEFEDSKGSKTMVTAGQLYIALVEVGTKITIRNPLENNLVNFLQWRISADIHSKGELNTLVDFDINGDRGNLATPQVTGNTVFFNELPFLFHIGKLAGREEILYKTRAANSKIFSFVIQGAFELQSRLLHEGDGLALWQADTVEIEALSHDAIIVLLEMPSWL